MGHFSMEISWAAGSLLSGNQHRYDNVHRYVSAAREAAQRAAGLTQRLLAFSRRQTLDARPLDANQLLGNLEDLIRRSVGPSINTNFEKAAGLWPICIDANQLDNAILNLCINARDAMPEGGSLTIHTSNEALGEKAARDLDMQPGDYVLICVEDNGTGMSAETIERAFDPFYTTKPLGQGTGLGLSMIYGFVRQSHGYIKIASELGKGTKMCLYLKRHHGALVEDGASVNGSPAPVEMAGRDVLIVDDEPIVRMLVTDVIDDIGHRYLEAGDGPSGLAILQSPAKIDLLITDVGLPGGMNGRQLADAARVLRPELKVLFITGYAENAAVRDGLVEPGMAVLTKPFSVEQLAVKVVEIMGDEA